MLLRSGVVGGDHLDQREQSVITVLSGMVEDLRLSAELSCLYVEASLGPAQHVRLAARTSHSMQQSVASQVKALRSVLPVVMGPERDRLLRAAMPAERPGPTAVVAGAREGR